MTSTLEKIVQKQGKIKNFSLRLYRALRPFNLESIPPDYINEKGTTRNTILEDTKKIRRCSQRIIYGQKKDDSQHQPGLIPLNPKYCNIPILCPHCAERLSRRRWNKLRPHIERAAQNHKYCYMVTFTTRDHPNINSNYEILTKGIERFFLKGQVRANGKRSGGEAAKIKAAFINKEIKIGENSKLWHIHGHSILFTDDALDYYIYDQEAKKELTKIIMKRYNRKPTKSELEPLRLDVGIYQKVKYNGLIENGEPLYDTEPVTVSYSKLTRQWHEATDGSGYNLKIQVLAKPGKPLTKDKLNNTIREALKYFSKVNDFNVEQIYTILANRRGKRFFSTHGELYDIELEATDRNPDTISELDNIFIYDYSIENRSMKPAGQEAKKAVIDYLRDREKYDNYRGKIIKLSKYKERCIDSIMKVYNSIGENEREKVKLSVIKHIDVLNDSYKTAKVKLFKKMILGENDINNKLNLKALDRSQSPFIELSGKAKEKQESESAIKLYLRMIKTHNG